MKLYRSSRPEVFLRKGILKIYSIFAREHPCPSAISIKLQYNFIEITLNLLHIFRTTFLKNTSGRLLLTIVPFLFISLRYDWPALICSKQHKKHQNHIIGICSKLTMMKTIWRHWHCSGVSIVNFQQISRIVLVIPLLILNRQMPVEE